MNNKQIAAELRRSALYDKDPYNEARPGVWEDLVDYRGHHPNNLSQMSDTDLRTFYLLVSEALDE